MTGREYMDAISRVRREIRLLKEQVERDMILAAGVSAIRYDTDPVQSSPSADKMVDIVARISENTDALKARIKYLQDLEDNARAFLVHLREEHERVLTLHYLDGLSWLAVSESMGYSERHIFRLHDQAIQEFDELLN